MLLLIVVLLDYLMVVFDLLVRGPKIDMSNS